MCHLRTNPSLIRIYINIHALAGDRVSASSGGNQGRVLGAEGERQNKRSADGLLREPISILPFRLVLLLGVKKRACIKPKSQ